MLYEQFHFTKIGNYFIIAIKFTRNLRKILPLYRRFSAIYQILIGLGKMARPKETAIDRKWRRVDSLQNQISRWVNHRPLLLRVATPKHIDDTLLLLGNFSHHSVGKSFPTTTRVRGRLVSPNRQHRIEHQHPLLRPAIKVSTHRNRHAQVVGDLLEDIAQRWRKVNPVIDRKAQAICLTITVIRILSNNHNLQLFKRALIKGSEYISRLRKDLM